MEDYSDVYVDSCHFEVREEGLGTHFTHAFFFAAQNLAHDFWFMIFTLAG